MQEEFKPVINTPPDSFLNWLKFQFRLVLDFQVNTVYRHMQEFIPGFDGEILDVGCGQSPYKHLLNIQKTRYYGIDIYDALKNFEYYHSEVIHFDGLHIPFDDSSIDCFICTEVLEHVENPKKIVEEVYRVLKLNGLGIVTVPWSARYHYIPYDFYRFTPSMLTLLFKEFSSIKILHRGTDITVIASKIIVAYFRCLQPSKKVALWPLKIIYSLIILPFIISCIGIGHLSLIFNLGSKDDPLGYTVMLRK